MRAITDQSNWLFRFTARLPMTGVAMLVALQLPVLAAEKTDVEKGHALLQQYCSRCHAIGAEGASPFAPAPPFREVVKRYPVEDLAEALAEGIVSGHPAMPEFVFQPVQINAILAYLGSLGVPDGKAH